MYVIKLSLKLCTGRIKTGGKAITLTAQNSPRINTPNEFCFRSAQADNYKHRIEVGSLKQGFNISFYILYE